MAGLADFGFFFFGFFLLFDEVDDDEGRRGMMNKNVTLPTGWYENPVPEALSFLLLFTNSG